jgi:predicted ATPase
MALEVPSTREHALDLGQDIVSAAQLWLALVLAVMGRIADATSLEEQGLSRARDTAHPFSIAYAFNLAARVRHTLRDAAGVLGHADAAVALSQQRNFAAQAAVGNIYRGWALSDAGETAVGLTCIRASLAVYRASGSRLLLPHFLALLAEILQRAGQAPEGLAALAEAFALAEITREQLYTAEGLRLQGEIALQEDRHIDAEASFHDSIETARRQGARLLEWRATVSMSRLWKLQGRTTAAREALAGLDGFIEGGSIGTSLMPEI